MIKRLRPPHTPETLAEIYGKTYLHSEWDEHINRVKWTVERLNTFLTMNLGITNAVDLSCGDGEVLRQLTTITKKTYGDIAKGEHLDVVGPIEQTILAQRGHILILSETLEHLDDPAVVLERAAERFPWIAITTPLGEEDGEKNYEHYWGWDLWGISGLFTGTGWNPKWVDTFSQPYYTYQLWIARSQWC